MTLYKDDSFKKYYELGDFLGSSGFADIFNGINKNTKEKVAIKLASRQTIEEYLINHNIPNDEENIQKFINILTNEVKYMNIIQQNNEETNDNVVKIIDCFYDKKEFAIIMELCDTNLFDHVSEKDRGLNSEEIYYILKQLNNSFEIMNKKTILHRALRLENILIKYKNKEKDEFIVKLKLTDDCCSLGDSFNLLHDKMFSNCRIYAPEVLNEGQYTKESDLWSLGILIYLLYFRQYPFLGDNQEKVKESIYNRGLEKLDKIENPDLKDLINQLLIKEPKRRISWEEYFEHPFFRKKQDYKKYYQRGDDIIGKSFFGIIYKGEDLMTKEKKAIKIMSIARVKQFIQQQFPGIIKIVTEKDLEPYINGFLNEVNHMKILQGQNNENKNTVVFNEYFNTEREFVIIMELCDDNLLRYIQNINLDIDTIHEILSQLNNSFQRMVNYNLLHGAIRLENVLINYEKYNKNRFIIKLKLTDDSKLMSNSSIIEDAKIRKNLNIYAPEVLKKEPYSEKSDLWSLGILIYCLCFKEYPFQGKNDKEVLASIDKGIKNNIQNENLKDLVNKLLNKDPAKRITWKEYFEHKFFKVNNKYTDYYQKGKELGRSVNLLGIVYEANNLKNKEEKFAIKIYEKRKVKDDIKRKLDKIRKITDEDMKPYIDGFLNEVNHMKILQGINNENENTVIFKEYFNTEEEFAIVMELCDKDLSKNEKKLNYKEIKAILRQLNKSFKIMTQNKILHRAIRPENILIKNKNEETIYKLKLTDDSGLLNDSTNIISSDKIKKNFRIYSPEVLRGEKYSEESDLWSIGVLTYYLYYKEYPFQGKDHKEVLDKIEKGIKIDIKENDLYDFVKKLLNKDPLKRMSWREYFSHPFLATNA